MVRRQNRKGADVEVTWVLTPLVASNLIVGLAGFGARPGLGVILYSGLVITVTDSSPGPGRDRCQGGGRSWVPHQGPMEPQLLCLIEPYTPPLFELVDPDSMKGSGSIPPIHCAFDIQSFRWVTIFCLMYPSSLSITIKYPWTNRGIEISWSAAGLPAEV